MSHPLVKVKAKVKMKGGELEARLKKALEQAHGAYVSIGIHDGTTTYHDSQVTVAQVALWQEFGTKVNGNARVPSRSFLRNTIDEHEGEINELRVKALQKMVYDGWGAEKALKMIGERIKIMMQNKIQSSIPPPLAASTLAKKRRLGQPDTPLIATGLLISKIGYVVVMGHGGEGHGEGGHGHSEGGHGHAESGGGGHHE